MHVAGMSSSTAIAVVGLNAALQKRFVMEGPLVPGAVHRASRISTGVGGKGQDVACALTCLNQWKTTDDTASNDSPASTTISLLQFIGSGAAGDEVHDILDHRFGISMATTVRTATSLRTCTSLVGPDLTTELVEPSGGITAEEFESLLEKIPPDISAVCFMGSVPPGCSDDAYARIYQRIVQISSSSSSSSSSLTKTPSSPLCVIDSVAGLSSLLQQVQAERTILKLNVSEFCKFVGFDIPPEHEATGSTNQVVRKAMQQFRQLQYHCQVALTDGAHGAYLDDGIVLYKLPVPKLPNDKTTLFPIGAGDAVAAGLVWAWMKQLEDPFAFGMACGSASCLNEENSLFDPYVAMDFYRRREPATIICRHHQMC
jgi:fructose-1-phosphate kinase PfkB-like protein